MLAIGAGRGIGLQVHPPPRSRGDRDESTQAHRQLAAVLVAVLALVAAVGGTALADSGSIAGSVVKALKKAKKALKKAKQNAGSIEQIELTPEPQGAAGQNAAENIVTRNEIGSAVQVASCNAGERVVGGGAAVSEVAVSLQVNGPDPTSGAPTGWKAKATTGDVLAMVLCASP